MYTDKKVLLIGGGGTLGTYTAEELLRLGCKVDIICLEDKTSDDERLRYYKEKVSQELLADMFKKEQYDGIVDFIHYLEVEDYRPYHKLLTDHTDHLIFLSSYRIYADQEHPVTEKSPVLLDVMDDKEFLETEKYALSKARCEKFLWGESDADNWTVVRPVISFSDRRYDIVTCSDRKVIEKTKRGEKVLLPEKSRKLTAGLDWSGNTGKIIANLLFKKEAIKEAYTISTAQNMTWEEVANLYTKLIGTEFEWTDTDEYLNSDPDIKSNKWALYYDRFFDRKIDNRKVMQVTGLKPEDFLSIEEGLRIELSKVMDVRE